MFNLKPVPCLIVDHPFRFDHNQAQTHQLEKSPDAKIWATVTAAT